MWIWGTSQCQAFCSRLVFLCGGMGKKGFQNTQSRHISDTVRESPYSIEWGGCGSNVSISDSFVTSVLLLKNSCHSLRGFYDWWFIHVIIPTALRCREQYPSFVGMGEKGEAICQASEGWSQYLSQNLPTPKPLPLLLTCHTTNWGDPSRL